MDKLLLDDVHASAANASVKLQLFGNLLHSLALQVAPFVFVIEDLQWLDSSSWKMLVQSEHWTHGLMMVCTTRPGEPHSPQPPHVNNPLTPLISWHAYSPAARCRPLHVRVQGAGYHTRDPRAPRLS
jgi:hypothetical protein